MNVALCVGINYYAFAGRLEECVKDARNMTNALKKNGDGSPNFEVLSMYVRDEETAITRAKLSTYVEKLFEKNVETALFYFSGHGATDDHGSYLCTSETMEIQDGLSMETLMNIVRKSNARNKVIILDTCHSGKMGCMTGMPDCAVLPENTTILAACEANDVSYEGVFTPLVVEALNGGAANLVGEVTPGSVYSYVDRALGVWFQHPMFKANIDTFVCLRKAKPPIEPEKLRMITEIFQDPDADLPLDPSYEEDKHHSKEVTRDPEHEAVFKILRKYAALNLVEPVGEEFMYWAAVNSKACRLTAQGKYYWKLVRDSRI